jgi:hypothetical protein
MKLTEPTIDINQSLARLEHDNDFITVMGWLRSNLEKVSELNDSMEDNTRLRQGQGAAQVLRQFIEASVDARKKIAKRRAV